MSRHDIDSMDNSFVVSLDITVTSNILQEIVQILSKKYTKKSNFVLIQQRCIPEKQLTKWSFYQTVNKRIKVCQNFWQRKYFCLVRELQELFPYSTVWLWIAWFMDKSLISRESFFEAILKFFENVFCVFKGVKKWQMMWQYVLLLYTDIPHL